jgi:hypothetical protein
MRSYRNSGIFFSLLFPEIPYVGGCLHNRDGMGLSTVNPDMAKVFAVVALHKAVLAFVCLHFVI